MPQPPATRRDFLRVGALGASGLAGLTLVDWLRARASAAAESDGAIVRPRATACILVWLDGGPSHFETFDPKPDAPVEVRGPLGTIATRVAGVRLSECLPRLATQLPRLAIVRSVTSPLGEHNFGAHYLLTGYQPTPALEYPAVGSVVAHLRGRQTLPGHVAVPDFRVGGGKLSGQGFLPDEARPFAVSGDPARPEFRVPDLSFYPGHDGARLDRRRAFLARFDGFRRGVEQSQAAPSDPHFEQAYRLLTSPLAREAFQLAREPDAVRARYGPRTIGQSCLLARRLVESGVPFVTVNHAGWDTHDSLVLRLKEGYAGAKVGVGLAPTFDQALAALLEDLDQRGLLATTLVVAMGEFGRTPKLNTAGGRDHWPRVFSVVLAGAGIAGGQVVGASDATGESPADRPVTPDDLAATLYHLLGLDPRRRLVTRDGRPIELSRDGAALQEFVG